ncbi:MAG: GNAT family N-acetyltransferase, partial [Filifactoraceae bacterium]
FVPVGFIGLMKAFTPHYSGWWIDLLAVLPEFQSKGIGSEFVEFAINHYKFDDLILTALIRNDNFASVKAIMKNGFNKMGENDFSLFVLD